MADPVPQESDRLPNHSEFESSEEESEAVEGTEQPIELAIPHEPAPLAPPEVRQTQPIALVLKLTRRPLWQVVLGLSGGVLVLTLLAIELLAFSSLALQTLGRAIVATVAGATTLAIFLSVPAGLAWGVRRSLNEAVEKESSARSIVVAIAIGGAVFGVILRVWLWPPA